MSQIGSELERLENPSPAALRDEIARLDRPLLITGVAEHWPALQKWNLEYFRSKFGTLPIDIITQNSREPRKYWRESRKVRTDMATFLDGIEDAVPLQYLNLWDVFSQIPELQSDIGALYDYHCFDRPYPQQLTTRLRMPSTLWIGPAGVFTPLHRDPAHNVLFQVMGRKRFVLFAPGTEKLLYAPWHEFCTENRCLGGYSPIDVESPDLEQFPLFRYASAVECTLEPGDMLYVPRLWWHFVISRNLTMSLSSWWFRSITHWRSSTAAWTPLAAATRCWIRKNVRHQMGRLMGASAHQ